MVSFVGCFEDTEIDSAVIEVLPESDCLLLDVVGNECTGGAILEVTNNCPEVFTPNCESCSDILAGEVGQIAMPLEDSEEMTHVLQASLGEQDIKISVTYSGRVTNTYEGCSSAGASPLSFLALLVGAFGLRLRRRRG